jgi:hypothetical protein
MKLWIARYRWGALSLFNHKPYLNNGVWCADRDIDEEGEWFLEPAFPEVTFENSPQEVELVIKK